MIKTDGKTFKKFYKDDNFWRDAIHDFVIIRRNGGDDEDLDIDKVKPKDEIEIVSGVAVRLDAFHALPVYESDEFSFEKFFKLWLEEQKEDYDTYVIVIPRSVKIKDVRDFITSLKGRIGRKVKL